VFAVNDLNDLFIVSIVLSVFLFTLCVTVAGSFLLCHFSDLSVTLPAMASLLLISVFVGLLLLKRSITADAQDNNMTEWFLFLFLKPTVFTRRYLLNQVFIL